MSLPVSDDGTLAGTAVIPAWLLATDPAVVPLAAKALYLALSLRAGDGVIPNDPVAIAEPFPDLFSVLLDLPEEKADAIWRGWLNALARVGIIALEYGETFDSISGIRFNLYRQAAS